MKQVLLFLIGIYSVIGISQSDIRSIGTLPESINETSGLIFHNGKLITHTDSGNAPELYELDPETLQITRTVRILNTDNMDWEDIAQDDDFIYIGDIGNNNGNRQNFGILRIAKSDFDRSNAVNAERTTFAYGDQTNFTSSDKSDFDAEALFVFGDDLIILTKQWQSGGTVAYRVPKTPGAYLAERLNTYQVDGLVTGADFDASSNSLYLVGYSWSLVPFFVEIHESTSTSIFGSQQRRTDLGIGPAQVEALTFFDDRFYVSSEGLTNPPLVGLPSQLFAFSLDGVGEGEVPTSNSTTDNPEPFTDLVVFKPANSLVLSYELNTDKSISGRGVFDSNGRLVSYTPLEYITANTIDISGFGQGLYYLAFFYGNSAMASPFFKD